MKCADCLLVIEEYFDGELNERARLQVKEHLTGCPSCSSVLNSLSAYQDIYANYDPEIETTPELWAGIRARIVDDNPAARTSVAERLQHWLGTTFALPSISGAVAAGLVILSIGLTVAVMKYISKPVADSSRTSNQTSATATPLPLETRALEPREDQGNAPEFPQGQKIAGTKASGTSSAVPGKTRALSQPKESNRITKTPDQLVREAEQKYLAAIAMLSRNVERRRSHLDAPALAKLDLALASIDRTIAETRKALRRHPEDPLAAQYMLTAYAKKIDVLREMVDY